GQQFQRPRIPLRGSCERDRAGAARIKVVLLTSHIAKSSVRFPSSERDPAGSRGLPGIAGTNFSPSVRRRSKEPTPALFPRSPARRALDVVLHLAWNFARHPSKLPARPAA